MATLIKPRMAWVFETKNPFEPTKVDKHQVPMGTTIWEWVCGRYPQVREFPVPTICLVNGRALLRKDWTYHVKDGDVVNFVAVPEGPALIIAAIIIVAAIAVSLLMPVPPTPGAGPESDPVYSTKGQQNAIRLGEPIEVCYGRNRIYPSLASRPFYRYENNDQFQHSLFCIGQGEYDISAIQIGDTSIDNYEEVTYEVLEPGEAATLFATNVLTSVEAGGQTLVAPNEAEYVADGWVGPFSANSSGTLAYKIEVDIAFPKGSYRMNSEGSLQQMSTSVEVEKRLIDDAGSPLGAWSALVAPLTITMKTTTPQRKTYSATVAEGRYEVRMRRTDNKNTTARAGDEVVWEGMRAYITEAEAHDFGNVTLLAVKIRATSNLNAQTQARFNVIATRKLPIRESNGTFSAPVATRSIVWALVDIFRSTYGGRLADNFFDWDALEALDALYATRGEYFDWVFRDATTVWEAAKVVAQVGRAVPLLSGSIVTMKRDGPLTVPVAVFNQDNIIAGSFQWQIKLWDVDEHDSLRVEYTDVTTGYKQEQVTAVLPGGTSDNPEDIRVLGIQNRTHAYRQGMYMLAANKYLRENVTFETGLEGYIPTYGDLIAVVHDVPSWGQGGYIVDASRGSGENYHLWLSEPVTFSEGLTHQVLLRSKTSAVIGPLTAYQTESNQEIIIQSATDIDFLLDGKSEPMLFLFGVSNNITKYLKVVRIEPQGDEKIRITAVNEDARVHSFDTLTPSALYQLPYDPFPPDLPEIAELYITQLDGALHIIQVSWLAAFGAEYYIVQTSEDGTNWQEQGTTTRTSIQLQVNPGDLYVRVAAVGSGQGPWIEDTIDVGFLKALAIAVEWDNGLSWEVTWFEVLNAVGYEVKIYDNSGVSPVLKRTVTNAIGSRSYEYTYAMAVADGNVVREMLITVDPLFDNDAGGTAPSGTPAEQEMSNTLPTAPTGIGSEISSVESAEVNYRLYWTVPAENDLVRLRVWLSLTPGFNPAVTAPLIDEMVSPIGLHEAIPTQAFIAIPLESHGGHDAYYWRVALNDVWGDELTTNISAEQTIAAYV